MNSQQDRIVAYVRLENPGERLRIAQSALHESIIAHRLKPLAVRGGKKLNLLGDVLCQARNACRADAFVWCNSDVTLTKNPFDVPNPKQVYGFFRREMPSGNICTGVDMYYIPVEWWDKYLSNDIPRLYVGASFVDWWISRAMQKTGAYENLSGFIDHLSHEQSGAASSDGNPYYQSNFRAYNRWAARNGQGVIPAPRFLLPWLGHVWGARDALGKLAAKLRAKTSAAQPRLLR